MLTSAQDGPADQHVLQRREAEVADGQRGGGAPGGGVQARHVRHGGRVDHLGERQKMYILKLKNVVLSLRFMFFCGVVLGSGLVVRGRDNARQGVHYHK